MDLAELSPQLTGTIHFIQPVEPFDNVFGDGGDDFFNYYCRHNWIAYQYLENGRCSLGCDFRFFELARLESQHPESFGDAARLDAILKHYEDVHSGFRESRDYFFHHGCLYSRPEAAPTPDLRKLELLMALGGPSEEHSCNWAALSQTVPLNEDPGNSLPLTPDGREFIFVGELVSFHYVWSRHYALGCNLLLFYDPMTRTALTTFDWS
ncbi:MAG: hypothetical protein R3C49_17595 [Planctomycetaceae bacterium]